MEGEDNILDAIYEEDSFEDGEDVEMLDVEEGELVEENPQNGLGQSGGGNVSVANQEFQSKNRRRRAKKKKNKRNRNGPVTNITDIDRFVLDICRRLKERKSYMVYTAVGCLGIAALSDLVKEVDAVQSCGGQKTLDGRRFRTGGGILWSIIKTRDPKAYKEIMQKARDFEKQFKQPKNRQATEQKKEGSSQIIAKPSEDGTPANVSDDLQLISEMQTQGNQLNPEGRHVSVYDRLRIPVSYDDDLLGGPPKDDAT